MDTFQQARAILPKMPEEVFQLWFDGRIRANGWPPIAPEWRGALRGMPLSFWSALEWKRELVAIAYNRFTFDAQSIIDGLIEAHFQGTLNAYSTFVPDSKERLIAIVNFMKMHQALPGVLILFEANDLLELVDGSHRLAAFFAANRWNDTPLSLLQDAWVGRIDPSSSDAQMHRERG